MLSLAVAVAFHATLSAGALDPTDQPAPALSSASVAATDADIEAWLSLLDGEQWAESWRAASSLFKSRVTADDWTATVQSVRRPLGRVMSRTRLGATRTTTLPGAPDGEYEIVQMRTEFTNRADAVETVVLVREGSGWKVAGYFVR